MKTRKYTLNKRAESQDQTRDRIVQATMELHGTVGPASTTISAIADLAGVQRLTVYRHFPDEGALFEACSSKWLELNPPPPVPDKSKTADANAHRLQALTTLYRYYRHTEDMWTLIYRDRNLPALAGPLEKFHDYLDACAEALAAGAARPSDALRLTARHVVQFSTWSSLRAFRCSDTRAARIVCSWLDCEENSREEA